MDEKITEKINVSKQVESQINKAEQAHTADEALKYSQAACNVANALCALNRSDTQ